MKIYIEALELSLSPEELRQHVSAEKLEALKGKGILQAYTLAHEGESRPRVIGQGTQTLRWPRAVIRTLSDKIKTGIKFFVGHGADNSNEGRESVGEVLSSFTKEIAGKLSNIIIGWFPSKEKVQTMDTCSMEADIHTDEEFIVGDINEVTGIALGNSQQDHPAFPGALRLSMVQCFVEPQTKPRGENEMPEEPRRLTIDDVKRAIHDLNIHPWQLFGLDDFKKDDNVGKLFTENATLKAENEKLTKENKEVTEKSEKAVRKTEVVESQERLDVLLKEGFTDKQKQFIKSEFKPEDVKDLSEEGLKTYVEEGKKKFAEQAKLFGVEELTKPKPGVEGEADETDMEDQAMALLRGDEPKAADKS